MADLGCHVFGLYSYGGLHLKAVFPIYFSMSFLVHSAVLLIDIRNKDFSRQQRSCTYLRDAVSHIRMNIFGLIVPEKCLNILETVLFVMYKTLQSRAPLANRHTCIYKHNIEPYALYIGIMHPLVHTLAKMCTIAYLLQEDNYSPCNPCMSIQNCMYTVYQTKICTTFWFDVKMSLGNRSASIQKNFKVAG